MVGHLPNDLGMRGRLEQTTFVLLEGELAARALASFSAERPDVLDITTAANPPEETRRATASITRSVFSGPGEPK